MDNGNVDGLPGGSRGYWRFRKRKDARVPPSSYSPQIFNRVLYSQTQKFGLRRQLLRSRS
jgi:hypothetical protein